MCLALMVQASPAPSAIFAARPLVQRRSIFPTFPDSPNHRSLAPAAWRVTPVRRAMDSARPPQGGNRASHKEKTLLGYHDIRVGNEPDARLHRFVSVNLPDLVADPLRIWAGVGDLLFEGAEVGDAVPQVPLKSGFRFSTKAAMPSF
jgi:hypothetical protein